MSTDSDFKKTTHYMWGNAKNNTTLPTILLFLSDAVWITTKSAFVLMKQIKHKIPTFQFICLMGRLWFIFNLQSPHSAVVSSVSA